MKTMVLDASSVVWFEAPGLEDVYLSQCLIEPDGCGSEDLFMSRGRLVAGQALGGGVHPENDEAYYVLDGDAIVTLGEPGSEQPAKEFALRPDMVVFIPAGTFHALRNESDHRDFTFLGIWPRHPKVGSNGILDARIAAWGTSFRVWQKLPVGVPVGEGEGRHINTRLRRLDEPSTIVHGSGVLDVGDGHSE